MGSATSPARSLGPTGPVSRARAPALSRIPRSSRRPSRPAGATRLGPEEWRHDAMSVSKPASQAAKTAQQPPVSGGPAGPARWARARGPGHRRRAAWLAVVAAGTVLLAAACGGSPGSAASPEHTLYGRELTYSRCMRAHGVPDFPILKQGPGGSLVHPMSPPAGMLTSPGHDAAFRACLKLA